MLNMFLTRDGLPMFQIEQFENGERTLEEYYADNNNQKDYPIVTLVNEFSASASEVFAAGMIEAGGYDVLGTPTFGKGTMQVPESLESTNGDELQASIGRWLTPEGNWINNEGGDFLSVNPTILVEQNPFFEQFSIYLAPGETLEFDQVSLKIENAQGILSALGYDLRSDGYFDENTEAVVESYQADNNLPVTGIIDADTAASLSADLFAYKQDAINDTQLQAAIDHLSE
jgi:carboxyl-terminal processing protease